MDLEKLEKMFEENEDEYLEFDNIKNKLSERADLHAFLLIDQLCPSDQDMIAACEHDEYYLSVEPEYFAKVATEEQVLDLIRCGVSYDPDTESFTLFA